jgi:3-oxoacyl-[acyl-carrier-protein] synthase-3
LIKATEAETFPIDALVYGTDGSGAENLIVPTGGARRARDDRSAQVAHDKYGNLRSPNNLYMNGQEIFTFTLRAVPTLVKDVLAKANLSLPEIDLFVFHQANAYMLESVRKKLGIAPERFMLHMAQCGNTVSSTIPIALKHAVLEGRLKPGQTAMLIGFGVGYSWAGAVLRWHPAPG